MTNSSDTKTTDLAWEEAGRAWGARAGDWATLIDPWTLPVYLDVLDHLDVRPGHRVVDLACGTGRFLLEASRRGAVGAGLDASAEMIDIAAERLPDGDLRVGDIDRLPWPDDAFDVVTSFNGVWGLDGPMAEARRVLRPGGMFAMSFFGDLDRMDLTPSWTHAVLELSPEHDGPDLLAVSAPGAAAFAVERVGMLPVIQGTTTCGQEFPDVATAVRAYTALGPAWTAIQHSGEERWVARLTELFEPFTAPSGIVRLVNEWAWIVARG